MQLNRANELSRFFLNLIFFGFILFTSIDNSPHEVSNAFIIIYTFLLFVPAWLNNFLLLPYLRRTRKSNQYLILLLISFLISVFLGGSVLRWIYRQSGTCGLGNFTSIAVTSSAPEGYQIYQPFFDIFPGMLIIMFALGAAYAVKEYILTLRKNEIISSEHTLAELNLLKSQVSPHFLFNVLNSLYALSLKMSPETPEVILKLSTILRYSLYDSQTRETPLSKEIHILETYIGIENLRLPATATVTFDHKLLDPSARVAPMLLLPLVENAFKHGIDSTVDASFIEINLLCSDGFLKFTVKNNYKPGQSAGYGGIGIENIRKRLQLLYSGRHSLDLLQDAQTFTATLEINV